MKNKKLSIAIVSTFIAALGLSACSTVTADDKSIMTLTGYDGNEISIDTNAIYEKYKTSENGISRFYRAILEVMIRNYFETSEDPSVKTKYAELKEKASSDVKNDQSDARKNSNSNGTTYDTEWQAILDKNDVDDEEGLYQKYLYEYEKTEYEDKYFDNNLVDLTKEYIGFDDAGTAVSGKHASQLPYHVRHILVNTSASATDYVTGEITSSEAQKLATVYEQLVAGNNTFGQVAYERSDDSSASSYGDAGIMDTATSFVNEFKLGIYAYDAIYSNKATGDDTIERDTYFGLDGDYDDGTQTIKEKLQDIGLKTVSYEVFKLLGDSYDVEKSDAGLQVNEGVAKYYPRNIYWNNYLNIHNVFVITNEELPAGIHTYDLPSEAASGKTGFRNIPALDSVIGAGKKVLTDELGRVIIGVRSEYGIHFMILQRTPFEIDGTVSGFNGTTYSYNNTTINEYWTTYKPGDVNYPVDTNGKDKVTYVNYMDTEMSVYSSRADTVKGKVKGFDSMYDYRIFEELVSNGQITINDETIKNAISTFIDNKREYNEWNDEKSVNDTWNSYLDKIALQYEIRDDETGIDNSSRLVKVTCAIHFKDYDPDGSLWSKGGACYYEK